MIITISSFIGLFLLLFQPFGLYYLDISHKNLILFGYGFVTFGILVFNLIILQKIFYLIFNEDNWTVLKQIIWLIWIIFTIGLGNFFYSKLIFNYPWSSWEGLLQFEFYTTIIGIIPVTVLTISKQNRLLAKHLKSAKELNEKLQKIGVTQNLDANEIITFLAENEKDQITIQLQNLLYIESTGNYVEVVHLQDKKIKKSILRNTLKNIEIQLKNHPYLLRCHRAYIVNLQKIIKATGNSQGYRLKLENIEEEVPVSRGYTKSLKERLN